MKKFISFMLCCLLLFSSSLPALAATNAPATGPEIQRMTINEYEALEQLSKESDSALLQKGYSSDEISQIKNYRTVYAEHITSLQSLQAEVLAKHGYNAAQISAIQNFNGSEEQMRLASASFEIYSQTASFTYPDSGGRTSGRLAYGWSWLGIPAAKMRDMVAVSWNGWILTREGSDIAYYSVSTGNYYGTFSASYNAPTNNAWNGAGHKFSVSKSDNLYYAKNGGGFFEVECDGLYQKDFFYYIEYGHATFSLDISFGVSVPGGAAGTISFSTGVNVVGSDSGQHRW